MYDDCEATALDPRRFWFGAVGVFLMAAIPRIARAWESVPDLLTRSTWDDTYYYFGIARNIMDGNGASFDGVHATNGFHPLWLALITPFWSFGGETPIHLALTLGALLGAATAALIFLILLRATSSPVASFVGGGFFALHPAAVTDGVNGMESAVTVFMLAAVSYALLGLRFDAGGSQRIGGDVLFGVCCGGLMLARTDMVVVVGAVLLYVALRTGRAGTMRLATMAATAVAFVVPWFIWSYAATGSFVQVSGRAGGLQLRQAFEEQHGDALSARLEHGLDLTWDMLSRDLPHAYIVPGDFDGRLLFPIALSATLLIAWVSRRGGGEAYRDAALALGVLTGGLLLMLAYHSGVRFFSRSWYFTPTAFISAMGLGLTVHAVGAVVDEYAQRFAGSIRPVKLALLALMLLALVAVYQPYDAMGWGGDHPHELNAYEGARWLRENTTPDTRAGSFNGGIIGYFSDRTVVNLDGVVNEGAYEALRDCTMTTYVRDQRLAYIVDFRNAIIGAACGPPVVEYRVVDTVGSPDVVFGAVDITAVEPVDTP